MTLVHNRGLLQCPRGKLKMLTEFPQYFLEDSRNKIFIFSEQLKFENLFKTSKLTSNLFFTSVFFAYLLSEILLNNSTYLSHTKLAFLYF